MTVLRPQTAIKLVFEFERNSPARFHDNSDKNREVILEMHGKIIKKTAQTLFKSNLHKFTSESRNVMQLNSVGVIFFTLMRFPNTRLACCFCETRTVFDAK